MNRNTGVARCYIFKPNIPIWVNFGGSCNGSHFLLLTFGELYGQFVYFMVVLYILLSFGIFFPFWYVVTTLKIWQPCLRQHEYANLQQTLTARN
jgi:hypothetical protein